MITKRFSMVLSAMALMGAAFSPQAAVAAEPTAIGSFEAWEAFTYRTRDTRVCYIFSKPVKSEAARKVKRDPIFFMVTHMPGRKVKGQVSTIIGYPFKEESKVKLAIDDKAFELYTEGDMAWAGLPQMDADIIKSLKTGKSLTVVGTSTRGTVTTDTYSLAGISSAMDKIDTTCK